MLSFTNVECPHCGAKGKIITPPLGAIIVGPCPACKDMVTIFCGVALPLDTTLMSEGAVEEKRRHLLETLTRFLEDRLHGLFNDDEPVFGGDMLEADDGIGEDEAFGAEAHVSAREVHDKILISDQEFQHFVDVDLSLLDNKHFFRAVFG